MSIYVIVQFLVIIPNLTETTLAYQSNKNIKRKIFQIQQLWFEFQLVRLT